VKTWKLLAVLVLSAAFFVTGYQYAAALYGEDIAELREDYATRAQQLEEKYREKERATAQSLVDAWEERDAALARVDDLTGDVERVRKQADAARRRLSGAGPDSCKSCREQLARCSGIVVRGAELVKRGVELSERAAIDKDAIVKMSSR
jgi:predicted negative regulator of RcsB-dependent stress response